MRDMVKSNKFQNLSQGTLIKRKLFIWKLTGVSSSGNFSGNVIVNLNTPPS